ncbi:hypothetical protein DEJ23_14415 [Curtobacterium sp. MCSS17_008]|nr:hypothetical protein DEJ23_14415 [Curtobacterium sp. MCSS17_008]
MEQTLSGAARRPDVFCSIDGGDDDGDDDHNGHVGRAPYRRARGCAVWYTSRSMSAVTSV